VIRAKLFQRPSPEDQRRFAESFGDDSPPSTEGQDFDNRTLGTVIKPDSGEPELDTKLVEPKKPVGRKKKVVENGLTDFDFLGEDGPDEISAAEAELLRPRGRNPLIDFV